jgi:hypothetical protein
MNNDIVQRARHIIQMLQERGDVDEQFELTAQGRREAAVGSGRQRPASLASWTCCRRWAFGIWS